VNQVWISGRQAATGSEVNQVWISGRQISREAATRSVRH
jgi:hypothetical protein